MKTWTVTLRDGMPVPEPNVGTSFVTNVVEIQEQP